MRDGDPNPATVYIARAIDGRPPEELQTTSAQLCGAVSAAGYLPIDPVRAYRERTEQGTDGEVDSDLRLLRRSDAILLDLSIRGWSYVGCICELVYAFLWDIPSVVLVGDTQMGQRMWVRHHASAIVATLDEATAALRNLAITGRRSDD